MRLRLNIPRTRVRHWHRRLIAALHDHFQGPVSVCIYEGDPGVPTAVQLFLSMEAMLGNRHARGTQPIADKETFNLGDSQTDNSQDHGPHLTLQLGPPEDTSGPATGPTLYLSYDGDLSEDALWLALFERRAPLLRCCFADTAAQTPLTIVETALPGLEARHHLAASADAVFSRAIELIVLACLAIQNRNASLPVDPLSQVDTAQSSLRPPGRQAKPSFTRGALFLERRVRDKALEYLNKILKRAPSWQVAWCRRLEIQPDQHITLDLDQFHCLPDDGKRFYADPFPVDHDGTTYLFVEEFPYTTERGIISVLTIGADGKHSEPYPVLDTGSHLSYPQVFHHDGDWWMLPEAAESGGLDLYRAERFPDRWQKVSRLIDQPLHDATLHHDGDTWWLFAATQAFASSTWCALRVYHAPSLHGPWQPVSTTVEKIDVRSSRPAGPLLKSGNGLWRPAQNCEENYGFGLTWNKLDTLTTAAFSETPVGSLAFDRARKIFGPHTWTASQAITTTDFFAAPLPKRR